MAEQSDPLFAPADLLIMTPTPLIEIPAQEKQMQKHKERVAKLPQPDQLIKNCTDAGFLKTVEVGQYFMTKHTDEFLQFAEPVTCREYKPQQSAARHLEFARKIGKRFCKSTSVFFVTLSRRIQSVDL